MIDAVRMPNEILCSVLLHLFQLPLHPLCPQRKGRLLPSEVVPSTWQTWQGARKGADREITRGSELATSDHQRLSRCTCFSLRFKLEIFIEDGIGKGKEGEKRPCSLYNEVCCVPKPWTMRNGIEAEASSQHTHHALTPIPPDTLPHIPCPDGNPASKTKYSSIGTSRAEHSRERNLTACPIYC